MEFGEAQFSLSREQIQQVDEFKNHTMENNEEWDTFVDKATNALNSQSGKKIVHCAGHTSTSRFQPGLV